jgi:hypothetical protein
MLSFVVETELETRDEERKPLLTLLDAGNYLAEKLEEWFSPLSFSAIALSGAAGDDYGAQFMYSRGLSHGLTRSRPVSNCRSSRLSE